MKNPHYTHEFICQYCGTLTIKKNRDKLSPRYCSQKCSQKGNIGRKLSEEKSLKNVIESFEEKVIKKEGCWGWKGHIGSHGYACLSSAYLKTSRAHRISYIIHKGKIPEGLLVLHSCHNKFCTNPNHLRVGTQKENVKDKYESNRQYIPSNLNAEKVKEIKFILKNKKISYCKIGKLYGVSATAIARIKKEKTWKHIQI